MDSGITNFRKFWKLLPKIANLTVIKINVIIKKHVLKKEYKEFVDLLNTYQKIESGSKMWGLFTDFNFYSLIPKRALYIEGFGKAYQKVY